MFKVKQSKSSATNENKLAIRAFGYMVEYFDHSFIFPICTLIHAENR